MSNALAKQEGPTLSPEILEQVLIFKNTKGLTPAQRVGFLDKLCASLGMNALTNPFEFINFQGKEIPYAKRDATDQLRRIWSVSIEIVSRETHEGIFTVTARAKMPSGRTDESVGAVVTAGIKGEALANSIMKAETKAKRRVTLSICGLGLLDESEIDTMPGAVEVPRDVTPEMSKPSLKEKPYDPANDPSKASKFSDAANYKFDFGTKEKGYLGLTVKEACDRDGIPKVQKYLGDIIESAEKPGGRGASHKWIRASEAVHSYAMSFIVDDENSAMDSKEKAIREALRSGSFELSENEENWNDRDRMVESGLMASVGGDDPSWANSAKRPR